MLLYIEDFLYLFLFMLLYIEDFEAHAVSYPVNIWDRLPYVQRNTVATSVSCSSVVL